MRKQTQHPDEHMALYEWCGAGTGGNGLVPAEMKRSHSWHASYGVLGVLTSLLLLQGCDGNTPAAKRETGIDQSARASAEEQLIESHQGFWAGPAQEPQAAADTQVPDAAAPAGTEITPQQP